MGGEWYALWEGSISLCVRACARVCGGSVPCVMHVCGADDVSVTGFEESRIGNAQHEEEMDAACDVNLLLVGAEKRCRCWHVCNFLYLHAGRESMEI